MVKKILAIIVVIVLIMNMILYAAGIVKGIVFWAILGAGALYVFAIQKKIKDK